MRQTIRQPDNFRNARQHDRRLFPLPSSSPASPFLSPCADFAYPPMGSVARLDGTFEPRIDCHACHAPCKVRRDSGARGDGDRASSRQQVGMDHRYRTLQAGFALGRWTVIHRSLLDLSRSRPSPLTFQVRLHRSGADWRAVVRTEGPDAEARERGPGSQVRGQG